MGQILSTSFDTRDNAHKMISIETPVLHDPDKETTSDASSDKRPDPEELERRFRKGNSSLFFLYYD